MFPEYEPQLNNLDQDDKTTVGKSFLFDFKTEEFVLRDGKLIEIDGIEALKSRINKILKTEKFKFKIYETGEENEYGVTLLNLVNSGHPQIFIQAEIQRSVTEALEKDIEILNIDNFIFSKEKRKLVISFEVESIYGTTLEEVIF